MTLGHSTEDGELTIQTMEETRFRAINEIITVVARSMWKKNYIVCYHVFYEIEDMVQVGWTRLIEAKSIKEQMLSTEIPKVASTLGLVAKRGMLDYIRSVLGREGKSCKRKGRLYTSHYMDYGIEEANALDIILPDERVCIEEDVINSIMMKEISSFLNKRLTRREKMIVDYIAHSDLSQKEIGKLFSITEARVSQLRNKAINEAKKVYGKE